ncbi:MAG TPA: YicC/YloC family endoribonuclease [Chthoniobacterales bacterium]
MTGYGRSQISKNGWAVTVEVNSVNRKQLEVAANLPREIASLEPRLRETTTGIVSRGRINAFVTYSQTAGADASSLIDTVFAAHAHAALFRLQQQLGLVGEISVDTLAAIPGVIRAQTTTVDAEAVWPVLEKALVEALKQLVEMREREGIQLSVDLRNRLSLIANNLEEIRRVHPAVVEKYRTALRERIRKIAGDLEIDAERLEKEVILFADRCDISEELTRLLSHLGQFELHLSSNQPVGRTLEFLVQEIGRELNTLSSKANDALISQLIVTCKAEIERIREQVQNIE